MVVDWKAWACQFNFGYVLGDRTYLADQKQLILDPELSSINDLQTHKISKNASQGNDFDVAVKNVAQLLVRSVGKQLQAHRSNRPVCFLSGGWDSRAIVACLLKYLTPSEFHVYTTNYDSGNNLEELFANQVASKLDLQHRVVPLRDDYYINNARSVFEKTNFATTMHVWMQEFLSQLDLPANAVNFDGYAGDILLRGLLQEQGDEKVEVSSDVFFKRLRIFDSSLVLSSPVAKTFEKLARQELSEELVKYSSKHRMLWFALNNRGRNGVLHSVGLQKKVMNAAMPFLDLELFDYVLSLDDSIRLRKDFYPAVLYCIDQRLEGIPSTNDKNALSYSRSIPVKKFSEKNISWFYNNFHPYLEDFNSSGGVVDWFSVSPAKQKLINSDNYSSRRALEVLNLYTLWLNHEKIVFSQETVLDSVNAYFDKKVELPPIVKQEFEYESIARKYLEKAKQFKHNELCFHWTMDVEAFSVSDPYAYHTASSFLVDRLILGDFGRGSEIESFFHFNKIPLTYFFEVYSSVWDDPSRLGDVIRFFKRDWSDVGLHCHAFSLPLNLRKHLGVGTDWVLRQQDLSRVLMYGKKLIESSINSDVAAFRTGRLDVYPNFEEAIANAGFSIDSSLVDGYDRNYFDPRSCMIGNGAFLNGRIIEFPITSYLKNNRNYILDFNNSSFEEICFVVVRALELGLPAVTLLMHSWSLSRVYEYSCLAKGFHYESDPLLNEKLRRIFDFLDRVESVRLCTLRETAIGKVSLVSGFSSSEFDLTPPPLRVWASVCDNQSILGRCEVLPVFSNVDVEYAFYLIVGGVKVAQRWYSSDSKVMFELPKGFFEQKVELRAFARERKKPNKMVSHITTVDFRKLPLFPKAVY